ncbi:unnamed protein product [Microthlaspi erraticum]|uniref:Uncharacterized protein n=1 Tax=Microthlaspi erraticum TaxID=1685480 RepID=A0A6D2KK51_9BRAS|nr:unnamed protein product [Microthlaspi erraticum]
MALSLYTELSLMKETVERIKGYVGEIEDDIVKSFKNSSSSFEAFLGTCRRLKILIEHMVTEMETRIEAQVVSKLQNVTL